MSFWRTDMCQPFNGGHLSTDKRLPYCCGISRRMETARLHRRKERKSWIDNTLYKHLFRKNEGCGANAFSFMFLCIVFGEERANLNTSVTFNS